VLSEPKPGVWFATSTVKPEAGLAAGVRLDRRSRMLYDDWHVFINGESFQASGRDATVMRRLADQRSLQARDLAALSMPARVLVDDWIGAGWLLSEAARGSEGGAT
jgi:50S ribosomal protein L16 3-hydroxylase